MLGHRLDLSLVPLRYSPTGERIQGIYQTNVNPGAPEGIPDTVETTRMVGYICRGKPQFSSNRRNVQVKYGKNSSNCSWCEANYVAASAHDIWECTEFGSQ